MNLLKEIRTLKGLTQFELSMRTRIHPIEISRIERGIVKPYPGWRRRIAAALEVPEEEIFGEEAVSNAGYSHRAGGS